MKAGLIDKSNEANLPHGWIEPGPNRVYMEIKNEGGPIGRKLHPGYNAMGIMLDRIRSLSTNEQNQKKSEKASHVNDEVFLSTASMKQSPKVSVIKPTSYLQQHYNVPVHNMFTNLLN